MFFDLGSRSLSIQTTKGYNLIDVTVHLRAWCRWMRSRLLCWCTPSRRYLSLTSHVILEEGRLRPATPAGCHATCQKSCSRYHRQLEHEHSTLKGLLCLDAVKVLLEPSALKLWKNPADRVLQAHFSASALAFALVWRDDRWFSRFPITPLLVCL